MGDICERYPQVGIHMKNSQVKDIISMVDKSEDGKNSSGEVDIEKFKKALSEVDTQMKSLPPTAQVAQTS